MSIGKKLQQLLNQLATDPPKTGRTIAEDGVVFNIIEFIRRLPISIARGWFPGASPFGSYGERTADGTEEDWPIWPDGEIVPLPIEGAQLTVVSTSVDDTVNGTNARVLEMHYLDGELNPQREIIDLDGLNAVLTEATDVRWVQCMHIHKFGANVKAAGIITSTFGGNTYSQINAGKKRCSSSFRMVPKGKVAYITGAVGSSISGTSAARTQMSLVASELDNHLYHYPLVLIPFAGIGLQDGPIGFTFPPGLRYSEGTLIGGTHTTDKGAIITLSWFGHLEPADTYPFLTAEHEH